MTIPQELCGYFPSSCVDNSQDLCVYFLGAIWRFAGAMWLLLRSYVAIPQELCGHFPGSMCVFPRGYVEISQELCDYSPGAM